ncbi:hypothetical protein TIFTF001_016648 [Ficus carica]|uniref:PPM-type phosphatase domain-containing protein n=1 Tax=Ficus carica TaxID=3494 RepID=A0AA88A974_FICCA|nr:hypothetical protein TIFTF001_016648 [Ficus carica]
MCVKEPEQVGEEMGNDGDNSNNNDKNDNDKQRPMQRETRNSQIQNWDDQSPLLSSSHRNFLANSLPLESICEDRVVADRQSQLNFVPALRSLLVANAGDCRAVLSRYGRATEMSNDHKPSCKKERTRVESLGGYVDEEFYLNSQLGVTRALGNWHLKGMKEMGDKSGPLSAEPELKLITLTREDEFLIIGSDGIWDVFSSQNAVDFARRRLQEHNDVKLCCKQIVDEALKRGATDNLTVVMVSFHLEPPPHVVVERPRVRRSISAEGLHNLKCLLEG